MSTKRLAIDIVMTGPNTLRKTGMFSGFAYVDSGFLTGHIASKDGPLTQAELVLLTAFTLTGCPIAARCTTDLLNPWRLTGGTYVGSRLLMGDAFQARSILRAKGDARSVTMRLDVAYEGDLPSLQAVAKPFQERIAQESRGCLTGHFALAFSDGAGQRHPVEARSRYELPIDVDVAEAWRNITILCADIAGGLNQVEQIDMFDSQIAADSDIWEKSELLSPDWLAASSSRRGDR